jgi:hypothetical protein
MALALFKGEAIGVDIGVGNDFVDEGHGQGGVMGWRMGSPPAGWALWPSFPAAHTMASRASAHRRPPLPKDQRAVVRRHRLIR